MTFFFFFFFFGVGYKEVVKYLKTMWYVRPIELEIFGSTRNPPPKYTFGFFLDDKYKLYNRILNYNVRFIDLNHKYLIQ